MSPQDVPPTPLRRRLAKGLFAGGLLAVSVALIGPLALLATADPAAADDTSVQADDERDAYIGRGGLVLPPGSASEAERRRTAACGECRWRLTDPCSADGGPCLSVTRGCPHGRLLRAWTSVDGGQTWRPVGLPCIGPGGPVTVESAGRTVADAVAASVAVAAIEVRPPAGVLPRLPVLFAARGQIPARIDLPVLGRPVEVVARPAWSWSFGDGAGGAAGAAAGMRAAHAFPRSGRFAVGLRTTWHGSYTVDGLGPFDLEPLHQDVSMVLVVGAGRAVLVP